jgi:hypothetical protein
MSIPRNTLILLVVFLALTLLALALPRLTGGGEDAADAFPTAPPVLLNINFTDIAELRIADAEGKTVHLERVDDFSWRMLQPQPAEPEEVDIFTLQMGLSQFMNLQYTPLAESIDDLAVVGLEPPAYILQVYFADGTRRTVEIGLLNALGNAYFGRLLGGEVVMVDASVVESILQLLETPPLAPTALPEATVEPSTTP